MKQGEPFSLLFFVIFINCMLVYEHDNLTLITFTINQISVFILLLADGYVAS